MATKKKTKKKQTKSKRTAGKKAAPMKKALKKKPAKKRVNPKKKVAKKKASPKNAGATKKQVRGKSQIVDTVAFAPEGLGARTGGQSGDLQGLSNIEGADSEGVAGLIEEGNGSQTDE